MVTLRIGEKEFELPEGWHEVNLDKFVKIIEKNNLIGEYKSQILFGLEILGILIDADVVELKNLTKKSFDTLSDEIKWINEAPVGMDKDEFEIDGGVFRPLKDLNKLTMGDNISLELVIGQSNEATFIVNILPILLRKVKRIKGEDGNYIEELEGFEDDKYEERKKLFMDNIFITDVVNFRDFF
jgi:hypothetical protein